jgi:hypothetical protein
MGTNIDERLWADLVADFQEAQAKKRAAGTPFDQAVRALQYKYSCEQIGANNAGTSLKRGPTCECGAKHTSRPSYHLKFCPLA